MSRVGIQQPSFAKGELTPRLFGRTDVQQYALGAETIENLIVRPEGGLTRRHGMRFAGETKDSSRFSRLVPFVVSTIQPYMLEFGNLYIRVWKNNAPIPATGIKIITGITQANPAVVTSNGHGFLNGQRVVIQAVAGMGQLNNREFVVANRTANTFQLTGVNSLGYDPYTGGGTAFQPYEIVSPYSEADINALFTTQSADTLYIVHPNFPPQTLVRVADTVWQLSAWPLAKGPWASINPDPDAYISVAGGFDPGDPATVNATKDIFEAGHAGSYMFIEEIHFAERNVFPYGNDRPNTVNAAVGEQMSNAGNVYECVDSIGGNLSGMVPPTHTIGEAWDSPKGATSRALFRYLHSRWCVVSLDVFVNSKQMTGKCITYLPTGLNPTQKSVSGAVAGTGGRIRLTITGHGWANGDWINVGTIGGVPNATGVWRIVNAAANTVELEGSVFGGAFTTAGNATRYATNLWRFGAFSNARGWPKTVCIHEQRLCFANTNAQPFGFWASKAGDYPNHYPGKAEDDEAIAYNIASNQVDPIRWLMSVSNVVLGALSSELSAYGGGLGDPITPSNTRIVPQSTEGSNATPPVMASGQILFVNRAGRKLFGMLYQTDVNQFVAEDLIELAAHIVLGKTIYRMAWAKNPLSALWVIMSDGTIASMTYRREQQVLAWARHPQANAFYESIAVIPTSDGTTDELWAIVRRTINGVTRRYIEYLARPFEPVTPTDKASMGFVDCSLGYNGAPVSNLTGLMHLEGQSVQIIADGARIGNQIVAAGKIVLPRPASVVWVGLGSTARLRTLRPEQAATVTAQGKTKRIPRVTVRVINTIGGKCGPHDESVMDPLIKSTVSDPTNPATPLFTGDTDVFLASDYGLDGRIAIVQDEPFPLDVLSLMPLINVAEG